MTPEQYCADKAARSGSSFYYAFLFLPARKKAAIQAVYAFCREVDDVADEVSDPGVAAQRLEWWRSEIGAAFNGGNPQHPVAQALQGIQEEFGLPEAYFLEVIDGVAMDLSQSRYETWQDLQLYCYRVASVVGLLSVEIFGYSERGTRTYAHRLGLAFQLTNILRDVREDAARGRIYLPLEDLRAFGVTEDDIRDARETEAFRKLAAYEAERARELYDQAFDALPESDRSNQTVGIIMAAIYRALLEAIAETDYRVLSHRVHLTPLRKLWIAWRTYRAERKRARRAPV